MDFLSTIFWLWDGGSEISLEVLMQGTEIGRGTAEKLWQALTQPLWLVVGVKQMKQGLQRLAIGVASGDSWVWKFLHVWCAHITWRSSNQHWEQLRFPGLHLYHVLHEYLLHLPWILTPPPQGTTQRGGHCPHDNVGEEVKYTWGIGQSYKLKPEGNKAAEFHSIYVRYELRAVDSAQWHEKLGRIQAKNIYCHDILTHQQLRAPQRQWLSRSYPLLWLRLIQQGSSLSHTFLTFLVFLTIPPMLQKAKARWKI